LSDCPAYVFAHQKLNFILGDPKFDVNVHLLAVFIEGSCLSGIIDPQVISMVTCEWE
jgi:hypothetical protein